MTDIIEERNWTLGLADRLTRNAKLIARCNVDYLLQEWQEMYWLAVEMGNDDLAAAYLEKIRRANTRTPHND